MIQNIFFALAAALGFAAIYFLWADPHSDYAFAAVVLTISAAFLSYRFKIRSRMTERQAPSDRDELPHDES